MSREGLFQPFKSGKVNKINQKGGRFAAAFLIKYFLFLTHKQTFDQSENTEHDDPGAEGESDIQMGIVGDINARPDDDDPPDLFHIRFLLASL